MVNVNKVKIVYWGSAEDELGDEKKAIWFREDFKENYEDR